MFAAPFTKVILMSIFTCMAGCVSDLIFGYTDEEWKTFTDVYREKVQSEIVKGSPPVEKTPAPTQSLPDRPHLKQKLSMDLKNAVCLASTGKLLSKEVERVVNAKASYNWDDVLEKTNVPLGNHTFLAKSEEIYKKSLDLLNAEHDWDPQITGTLTFLYTHSNPHGGDSDSIGATLATGVTQRMPFGGTASLNFQADRTENIAGPTSRDHTISIKGAIEQPLLRNFGYERAHEDVVQARKNLVYEIRDFELYRHDFTIDVTKRYYDLIRQQQVVQNNQRAYEQTLFTLQQTKALYERLGEKTAMDVLRAELSEQQARETLDEARQLYEESLDSFKIFLGLSPESDIEIVSSRPKFKEFSTRKDAEQSSLRNRLDLKNSFERLQDTARAIRFAKNDLLPNLDLFLNASLSNSDAKNFDDIHVRFDNFSAGIKLEIPFDRFKEKNSLRSSVLSFQQQIRAFLLEMDEIRSQIRNGIRSLQRLQRSLTNQQRQIEISQRKLKKAFLDFKEGAISNRDLVEAQEELRAAENAYIQTQVNYETDRLQLLRDMGILKLDQYGNVIEP